MWAIILLFAMIFQIQDIHCGGPGFDIVIVDNATKEAIVTQHNRIRKLETNAANMRKLSWDDGLAERCGRLLQECSNLVKEDNGYNSDIEGSGENFLWSDKNDRKITGDFTEVAIAEWHDQREIYVRNQCKSNQTLCQQYLRLVWARNDKIGCSAVSCEMGRRMTERIGTLFCCAYGPVNVTNESQYEDPKDIYIPGKPCSQCGENYGCDDNLCVSCDKSPSSCPTSAPVTATSTKQNAMEKNITAAPPSSTTSGSIRHATSTFVIQYSVFVGFMLKCIMIPS